MTADQSAMTMCACYEGASYDGAHSPFHLIKSSMTDEDLWAFLIALCEYGPQSQTPRDPMDAMHMLGTRSGRVLAGGVLIKMRDVVIEPGCCCGLEDWIGLKGLSRGSLTPWMGHDPAPWFDTSGPKAVLHSDEGEDNDTIAIDYADLERGVRQVARELTGFLHALTAWLGQFDREQAEATGTKIGEWFHIDR